MIILQQILLINKGTKLFLPRGGQMVITDLNIRSQNFTDYNSSIIVNGTSKINALAQNITNLFYIPNTSVSINSTNLIYKTVLQTLSGINTTGVELAGNILSNTTGVNITGTIHVINNTAGCFVYGIYNGGNICVNNTGTTTSNYYGIYNLGNIYATTNNSIMPLISAGIYSEANKSIKANTVSVYIKSDMFSNQYGIQASGNINISTISTISNVSGIYLTGYLSVQCDIANSYVYGIYNLGNIYANNTGKNTISYFGIYNSGNIYAATNDGTMPLTSVGIYSDVNKNIYANQYGVQIQGNISIIALNILSSVAGLYLSGYMSVQSNVANGYVYGIYNLRNIYINNTGTTTTRYFGIYNLGNIYAGTNSTIMPLNSTGIYSVNGVNITANLTAVNISSEMYSNIYGVSINGNISINGTSSVTARGIDMNKHINMLYNQNGGVCFGIRIANNIYVNNTGTLTTSYYGIYADGHIYAGTNGTILPRTSIGAMFTSTKNITGNTTGVCVNSSVYSNKTGIEVQNITVKYTVIPATSNITLKGITTYGYINISNTNTTNASAYIKSYGILTAGYIFTNDTQYQNTSQFTNYGIFINSYMYSRGTGIYLQSSIDANNTCFEQKTGSIMTSSSIGMKVNKILSVGNSINVLNCTNGTVSANGQNIPGSGTCIA